ncbi:hypothetical protein SRABI13_01601 [Erwinia aphidicola]|nr:hypothetical protein SRABI13_01601 [Erwinia aphidicola]
MIQNEVRWCIKSNCNYAARCIAIFIIRGNEGMWYGVPAKNDEFFSSMSH